MGTTHPPPVHVKIRDNIRVNIRLNIRVSIRVSIRVDFLTYRSARADSAVIGVGGPTLQRPVEPSTLIRADFITSLLHSNKARRYITW